MTYSTIRHDLDDGVLTDDGPAAGVIDRYRADMEAHRWHG